MLRMTATNPSSPYEGNRILYAIAAGGQQRDETYRALTQTYSERLFLHAFYIVHDAQEAKDIAQIVLGEKLLKQADQFATSGRTDEFKLQAWLYRVTRNLSFNLIRDRKRRDVILTKDVHSKSYDPDYLQAILNGKKSEYFKEAIETPLQNI